MKGWATAPLRISLGIIFIAHGAQKAFGAFGGSGIVRFAKMLSGMGLSYATLFAYLVAYIELIGGFFLILGICTRISSALLCVVMAVAVIGVHLKNGFFSSNGGFEYPFVLLFVCFSLLISGPGRFSMTKKL